MNDDLVTTIITTYKRPFAMLEVALNSVLSQTYSNIEIIVVDDNDNESDYSKEIIAGLQKYNSILYIKQNGNKGACLARNLGIRNAKGKYIAFLDDDDEWLPEKIEKQLNVFLNTERNVGIVFCQGYAITKSNNSENCRIHPEVVHKELCYKDLLYADYVGSIAPLILKEAIIKAGMFDGKMPARQDYDMWIRISRLYTVLGIEQPLFKFYFHDGEQITSSKKKALKGYIRIYEKYKDDYWKDSQLFNSIMDNLLSLSRTENFFLYYFFRIENKIFHVLRDKL